MALSGSCLCAYVRFECEDAFQAFHLCHCRECQKLTGSAHVSNLFTEPANIRWFSGADSIKRFDLAGRDFSHAFCVHCGSSVPYLNKLGDALIVPAGSLDTAPSIKADDHIFWSERAKWYDEALHCKKVFTDSL